MKYALIPLPDNFKKGNCEDCPLRVFDDYIGDFNCIPYGREDGCQIEIREVLKEEDGC